MKTIAALLTCHNRREKTLECLKALVAAVECSPEPLNLTIYVVDDGSTDGTAEVIRAAFPTSIVIKGDGTLYWSRGMHVAFEAAMTRGFDFYLWLNDDTILMDNAIGELWRALAACRNSVGAIAVGAVIDPLSKNPTYGGVRSIKCWWRPFMGYPLSCNGEPTMVDFFNGNVVLIPRRIADLVGNIESAYEHAFGDTDYSIRARRKGVALILSAQPVAMCPRNPIKNTYKDPTLPLRMRFSHALSRKGLPWRSWLIFTRRYGGVLWPIHFSWAYLKVLLGRM